MKMYENRTFEIWFIMDYAKISTSQIIHYNKVNKIEYKIIKASS